MELYLNIYTDESFREIERTEKADQLRIPYRVVMYIAQSLDGIDLKNENDLFNFAIKNVDKIDRIIKATFGVSDEELERVDVMELGKTAVELYKWFTKQVNSLNNKNSKNA